MHQKKPGEAGESQKEPGVAGISQKEPGRGRVGNRAQTAYSFTGDLGSSNKATMWATCFSVKIPICPARGMLEQAL